MIGVAIHVFSRICLSTLTMASHSVTWMGSKSTVVTVLLTVIEPKDNVAMGLKIRGITFSSFGKSMNICWLIIMDLYRISTPIVSATRDLDLTCKSPNIMSSSSCHKIITVSFVADVSCVDLLFSMK